MLLLCSRSGDPLSPPKQAESVGALPASSRVTRMVESRLADEALIQTAHVVGEGAVTREPCPKHNIGKRTACRQKNKYVGIYVPDASLLRVNATEAHLKFFH